jgi:hypothetical protein
MKLLIMSCFFALSASAFANKMAMPKTTQLDDLIRGEMAAIETYDTALKKIKDPNEAENYKRSDKIT